SSTHSVDAPQPRAASHAASAAGACPSRSSRMARPPGRSTGNSRSNGAACRPRQAISSIRQPSREAASEKLDSAGNARHSPGESCAARLPPAPCQNGSPEASTATRCPRQASTGAMSKGTGHARPRRPACASRRCRGPPNTISAASSAARLAGDRPDGPSSPRPMMDSQGSDMRVLLLGGTTEAAAMARALADAGIEALYSYAGRTSTPRPQPLPLRIGGFGGAEGLAACLRDGRFTHVIDATHPFAATISRNAVAACAAAGVPLLAVERPAWTPAPGDDWTPVPDLAAAAAALPEAPANVFLAIGRQNLDVFKGLPHRWLLRFVDPEPAPLPHATRIVDRGPFTQAGDMALMRE